MNVANQMKSATAIRQGSRTWAAIAVGAVVLILLSAAITWMVFETIAPRFGSNGGTTAVDRGPSNAGLVEFRRGERGLESVVVSTSSSGLVEFRRGERGGSAGAVTGDANPDPSLVEFRRGERDN
jgi:multisubunit Na+/H+ antiporter MnhB subunit